MKLLVPISSFLQLLDLRMMLVTKKSDSISGKTKLRAKYIVRRIQEECYDEHLSLIPDQFEEGKMRFLKGTLSFNLL